MPGLRLSVMQAQRLWGLDEPTCASLLELLIELRFLHRTGDGRFARLTEGGVLAPPLRMARAELDPMLAKPRAAGKPSAA